MAAKKAPAKKAPAKKAPASAAQFRMKEEADKKKMKRTDAQGRSGMGASKPKKYKDFYSSPAGKLVIATNPLLATGAVISAAERAARKKIKGKKWAGDPGLKPGE